MMLLGGWWMWWGAGGRWLDTYEDCACWQVWGGRSQVGGGRGQARSGCGQEGGHGQVRSRSCRQPLSSPRWLSGSGQSGWRLWAPSC